MRRRLTGRFRVALPPAEAFGLFTPQGEREWAHGWDPRFPDPDHADDAAPGTVFRTHGHAGETIWTVVAREPGRHVSYARVAHGIDAGTVSVTLDDDGEASDVTVTYELTALTEEAEDGLRAFADGYPAYLREWEEAIGAALTARTAGA